MRKRIEDREKAIMDAAVDVISKNDFEKIPVSEITDRAGVAKGTFYLYFKDKVDLRDKVVAAKYAEYFIEAYLKVGRKESRTLEDIVLFLFEDIIDRLAESEAICKLLPVQIHWKNFLDKIYKQCEEAGINIQAAYDKTLEVTGETYRDPDIMFYMLAEFANATCYNAIVNQTPVNIETLKPEILSAIKRIMEGFRIK